MDLMLLTDKLPTTYYKLIFRVLAFV